METIRSSLDRALTAHAQPVSAECATDITRSYHVCRNYHLGPEFSLIRTFEFPNGNLTDRRIAWLYAFTDEPSNRHSIVSSPYIHD